MYWPIWRGMGVSARPGVLRRHRHRHQKSCGWGERPTELRMKQAAAAVGQCRMMHIYDKLFAEYNRTVAQILLTGEDVESPVRSEHLHNTFEALLELGVIPVVRPTVPMAEATSKALSR